MRPMTPAFALAVALVGCAPPLDDRAIEIASVLADADLALIRARPSLVAGKYARMSSDPYAFYRGQLPVFRHDWERGAFGLAASALGATDAPSASLSLGDPHPENFGILRTRDGVFALEPNDFDAADRAPILWDVRRLVVGLAIASQAVDARGVAKAAARAYAVAMAGLAAGEARSPFDDPGRVALLDDLWKRGAEDMAARQELVDMTTVTGGARRLIRGPIDPAEPTQTLDELPDAVKAALPGALESYRTTLFEPPAADELRVIDAAREFGSGVSSWPRVRLLILVRGPSDAVEDDFILEMKELGDAALPPTAPPEVAFDDDGARVRSTSRAAWFRPDAAPLWGTTTLLGLPMQVKVELAGQANVRVKRFVDDLGTQGAVEDFAAVLGALLARVHAGDLVVGSSAQRISAAIGDPDGFAEEQAAVAVAYADVVIADAPRLAEARRVLGPTLGVAPEPGDAPPPDLAALYGEPEVAIP